MMGTLMKTALPLTALMFAAAFAAPEMLVSDASAASNTIRCTSANNRYTECPIYEQGVVRFARRLSDAACNEGQSWGVDRARGIVWVDRGCRADFTVDTRFSGGRPGNGFGQGPNGLPQNFRPLGNGTTEVTMSSNCVITYDASGYRARSSNGCSGGDITRADQQFAAYRSQLGYPNGQYGQFGQNGAAPNNMRFLPNGDTEIVMSNNCIITYNPGGYRIRNGNRCSGDDITRSDQQFTALRSQAPNQGGNGQQYRQNGQYGDMPNNIRLLPNGDAEIMLSGNCVAAYNSQGYRIRNSACSDNELRRADQQYATYRTQYNDGGYPNAQGPLPANMRSFQNGVVEITISQRCIVGYDATGYRIRTDPGCTGGNINQAELQYSRYRRR
jgi:hypothetical protein